MLNKVTPLSESTISTDVVFFAGTFQEVLNIGLAAENMAIYEDATYLYYQAVADKTIMKAPMQPNIHKPNIYQQYEEVLSKKMNTDFVVGTDIFSDLTINEVAEIEGLHYFKNSTKTFVKHFILKRTKLSEKVCRVTLIKKGNEKFEPRFDFFINDRTKKAVESLAVPIVEQETKLIKAKVNLDDCHKEFSQLLSFLHTFDAIEFEAEKYAVVTKDQKQLLSEVISSSAKEEVLRQVANKFGKQLSEDDITLITQRKTTLISFKKLLTDKPFVTQYREWLNAKGHNDRVEDVWQHFFENNTWIFGYGLQMIAGEALDDKKLETIVVGSDLFDGAGKRIDGLLKTKGSINMFLFAEIKRHDVDLLEKYDRSAVYAPAKDLRGAVAQIQKTIHKVNLKVTQNITLIKDKEGNPTGEQIAFVKPKAIVIIGKLDQFVTEIGVNDEMLSSFELYRQQLHGIEIITYDELYERTKYIVGEI